jgi:hypothetical protein
MKPKPTPPPYGGQLVPDDSWDAIVPPLPAHPPQPNGGRRGPALIPVAKSSIEQRHLCYVDQSKRVWVHWTFDADKIYAYAYKRNGSLKAVDDWWTKN